MTGRGGGGGGGGGSHAGSGCATEASRAASRLAPRSSTMYDRSDRIETLQQGAPAAQRRTQAPPSHPGRAAAGCLHGGDQGGQWSEVGWSLGRGARRRELRHATDSCPCERRRSAQWPPQERAHPPARALLRTLQQGVQPLLLAHHLSGHDDHKGAPPVARHVGRSSVQEADEEAARRVQERVQESRHATGCARPTDRPTVRPTDHVRAAADELTCRWTDGRQRCS